jgi:hypothetical protein
LRRLQRLVDLPFFDLDDISIERCGDLLAESVA